MYPAAHSMDVDWYAVDADGNVAYCFSNEEGGVPEIAHQQYWSELFEDLLAARIASAPAGDPFSESRALHAALATTTDPVERDLVQAILSGDRASRVVYTDWLEAHGRGREHMREPSLFAIQNGLDPVGLDAIPDNIDGVLRFEAAVNIKRFRALFDDEVRELDPGLGMPYSVAVRNMPRWVLDCWASDPELVGAYIVQATPDPAELGLYEYRAPWYGPYNRARIPQRPILVRTLPPQLRAKLEQLRIPQRFATIDVLAPEDFTACRYWGR